MAQRVARYVVDRNDSHHFDNYFGSNQSSSSVVILSLLNDSNGVMPPA